MAAQTVNIVSTDTFATLKAAEPYGSDYYGQFVFASDFDAVYRINLAGNMVGLNKTSVSSQLNVTGPSVSVASLPEDPTYLAVYVSGQRMVEGTTASTEPLAYYIPTGGGSVIFAVDLDEDSVLIEFLP